MDRKAVFERVSNVNVLPSPPQILIRFLETRGRNGNTSADLYDLVSLDPALCIKLITLGAPLKITEMGGRDVPSLLRRLDPELVRYVAINASVQQAFDRSHQDFYIGIIPFWRHSVWCALLARGLARMTAHEAVDEAYFAGLLHDIGKLTLYAKFPDVYDEHTGTLPVREAMADRDFEERNFGVTHEEIGSWLIRQAGLDTFFADAIHYHHDILFRIRDAAPLVKILYSANGLCDRSGVELDAHVEHVARLFSLPIGRIDSLTMECRDELDGMARSLDIVDNRAAGLPAAPPDREIAAPGGRESSFLSPTVQNKIQYLTYEVRDFSLLYGTLHNLLMAPSQADIFEKIQHSIQILFGVKQSLIFLYNSRKDRLEGPARKVRGELTTSEGIYIPCGEGRTLLSRTLIENMVRDSFGYLAYNQGTIIEEQIVRLLGTEGVLGIPLTAQGEKIGVLVLGIMENQFQRLSGQLKLLTVFADHIAGSLHMEALKRHHRSQLQLERLETAEKIARNVVREVNNPLGVMRNHLHLLGQKLDSQESAHDDIAVIKGEIQRVAQVMDQLSAFSARQPESASPTTVDVGALLTSLVGRIREELSIPLGIDLELDLNGGLPLVATQPDSLRAILKEVLANAVEALEESGEIVIRARRMGPREQRAIGERRRATGSVEIAVRDDGPGIPESIQQRLFEPYTTTKDEPHLGMGLSIVQNLIKQLQGHVICETDFRTGTTFRIILPVRS